MVTFAPQGDLCILRLQGLNEAENNPIRPREFGKILCYTKINVTLKKT